jgi:hypothetical protein
MGPRERLNDYLKAVKGKPFEWGQHDCLTFTNNAYKVMYGKGWADDWLDRYMVDGRPLRRRELIKEFKFSDFNFAVDTKLLRYAGIPPLGALVTTKQAQRWATGVAMGICTGTRAVFLSKQDVLYLPLDAIEQSWIKA